MASTIGPTAINSRQSLRGLRNQPGHTLDLAATAQNLTTALFFLPLNGKYTYVEYAPVRRRPNGPDQGQVDCTIQPAACFTCVPINNLTTGFRTGQVRNGLMLDPHETVLFVAMTRDNGV